MVICVSVRHAHLQFAKIVQNERNTKYIKIYFYFTHEGIHAYRSSLGGYNSSNFAHTLLMGCSWASHGPLMGLSRRAQSSRP